MKIGFYIHHTAISAGGIFTYSIGILRQIITANEIEKVVIITSKEIQARLNEFTGNPKVKIRIVDRNRFAVKSSYSLSYLIYNLAVIFEKYLSIKSGAIKKFSTFINPYRKILESEDISLLHIPVQYSPVYKINVPVITTMHDLQEYHFPEFFNSHEKRHRMINNAKAIFDSDHIIVSFNHVKTDIIKYFGIKEDKISVCSPPFAESWFISKSETSWSELSTKYGLKKNYLLYPAATWKHKNHETLLRALKKLLDKEIEVNLVCTGNKTAYYQNIQFVIDELELSANVKFLGIVSEEDLIGLYQNTSLVVIPTHYEAGSGPLYEAMRYKVPVVCSNVTSLPETMSNKEFLFNPNSIDEIIGLIEKGLTEPDFRKRNVDNSNQRMEFFTKVNYADKFINSYNLIIKNFSR